MNGLTAVDHAEEFNRINVAFVHAELSFCVSSRFCLSLWHWHSGRGKSSSKADLGTESRAERRALTADQVPCSG